MHTPEHRMNLPTFPSDSWIRWSVRKTDSPYSLRYLRNCHRSAEYFSYKYLRAPADLRPSFNEMTRRMHLLIARGLGRVPFGNRYRANAMYPHLMRQELLAEPSMGYGKVRCPMYVGDAIDLAIRNARSRSGRTLVARGTILFAGQRYRFSLHFVDAVCDAAIPQTPRVAHARLLLPEPGRSAIVVVPSCNVRGLTSLFLEAEREMGRILELSPEATRDSQGKRRQLFRCLARYYRLMVHGHFFLTQNNSMLMNQINCITYLHFGRVCMHHNLDALTFVLEEREFARLHERLIDHEETNPTR